MRKAESQRVTNLPANDRLLPHAAAPGRRACSTRRNPSASRRLLRGRGSCNAVFVDDVAKPALLASERAAGLFRRFSFPDAAPVTWGEFYGAYVTPGPPGSRCPRSTHGNSGANGVSVTAAFPVFSAIVAASSACSLRKASRAPRDFTFLTQERARFTQRKPPCGSTRRIKKVGYCAGIWPTKRNCADAAMNAGSKTNMTR